ncbi:hypothetical protein [Bacteroides sedimenti]|uniref:Mobilization protein n=1 Tax=Bacteroides sedimenti TaxID=2136147 RepID=A0ABM8IGV2_9BACE
MSKTYSEQITKVQLLTTGLKKNIELVKNKGLDEHFISKLEAEIVLAAGYNKETEQLRIDLRKKTIQANQKLAEVKQMVKEAKKVIKGDFAQTQWKEFGIIDKR